MLTDRELASLILLGAFAVFVLVRSKSRSSLRAVIVGFLNPRIALPFLLFAGYIALAVVTFGSWAQLWEPRLLKDTVIWFVASGAVLFFRFGEASQSGFVSRRIKGALKTTVFIEFYLNLVSFSLSWELVIQVLATLLATMSIVATLDPKTNGVGRWAASVLAFLGIGLLLATGWQLVSSLETLNAIATARDFLLPLWLTAFAVPFIYGLALYAHYEDAFRRLDREAKGGPARRRAKLALLTGLHVRDPDIAHFGGAWQTELASAATWRDARRKVHEYRRWRAVTEAAKQKASNDLVLYEGIAGTDEQGRQLDRREFAATIDALEQLSSAHMGWYWNPPEGSYKRKLGDILSIFARGLPEEHGIVMKVRKDGRAWYAVRRTVTGWVFAVGAKGEPPDQWFYDGPEPPMGYPGSDPAWGTRPFERGPNWDK